VTALFALLVVSVAARLTEPYLYKVVVDTLAEGLFSGVFTPGAVQTLVMTVVF